MLAVLSPPTLSFAGILSMIIIRTLRKDIANYNKEDDIVRGLGWGGMDWRGDKLRVGLSTCQACVHAHMYERSQSKYQRH